MVQEHSRHEAVRETRQPVAEFTARSRSRAREASECKALRLH